MRWLARLLMAAVLVEATALARSRAPLGIAFPDAAVALAAALAVAGERSVVLPAALALCLLRLPTTLAEPLSGFAVFVGFAWTVLATRRFVSRQRPAVVALAGALGFLALAAAASFAERARTGAAAPILPTIAAAVSTGILAALFVPALRRAGLTRPLLERRFGEAT